MKEERRMQKRERWEAPLGDVFVHLSVLLISYLLASLALPYLISMIARGGMLKVNWQGRVIPAISGIVFPLVLSFTMLPYLWTREKGGVLVFVLAIQGAAVVGLLDDVLGKNTPRGLSQHLRYFLFEKKLSTGLVKAIVVSLLALWVVTLFDLSPRQFGESSPLFLGELFLNWLLLVLTVNFVNLLDLRPGRALKGTAFLLLWPALMQAPGQGLLVSTLGIMLAYAPYDLPGKVMLGDTGSNVLGMIAGLLLLGTSFWSRMVFLVFFLFIHVVAERSSLSVWIDQTPALRKIDHWGRGRELVTKGLDEDD